MKFEEFVSFMDDKNTILTKITLERSDGKKLELTRKDILNYHRLWEKLSEGGKKK